jgi:NitT/TauT family transport system permease protein
VSITEPLPDVTEVVAEAAADVAAELDQAPPPPPRPRHRWIDVLGPVAVLVAFVGIWYLFHYLVLSDQRKFILPPPHVVIDVAFLRGATLAQLGEIGQRVLDDLIPFVSLNAEPDESIVLIDNLQALWLTAKVALVGLAVATIGGVAVAMMMSQAKWVERAFFPYAVIVQAIPILAIVPLIGSFWGFGFNARVIVCVIISFFPIMANTLFGLHSADAEMHDLFTLHRSSRWTRLRKLQVPAALPAFFTGLRIAAGLSVIGAIVGDFFFRRGEPGLGSQLDKYFGRADNPELFGAIILSSVLGISVFAFFGWLSQRIIGAWANDRPTS